MAAEVTGVLPAVLPLRGNGEMADLLGFKMGMAVQPMAVRLEIFTFLKKQMGSEQAEEGSIALAGARLWKRVDGLYTLLDRLALHGVNVRDLRRTVPEHLVGFWDLQAVTLLAVAEHVERWLARRGEMLCGGVEREVMLRAAEVLRRDECTWVPVVAGILDGVPAAIEIAKVAAERGHVIVPELGPVTQELSAAFEAILGCEAVRIGGASGEITESVAETDWDEAWLAALGVRKAVDEGKKRVAVVSPSRVLLERVSGILERWGMVVPVSGMQCMDKTPAGREVLAVAGWGIQYGTPAQWTQAMRGYEVPEDILFALEDVAGVDAWLAFEDWQAVMELVLGETAAPAGMVSEGVVLMGPLDARLLDFDTVIAAGAVEGVWPNASADAWLSEAHLRALGMPDATRKAQLMGTEFESVVAGGSREVRVLQARTIEGRETVPSRFMAPFKDRVLRDEDLGGVLDAVRHGEDEVGHGTLGIFRPEGALWPKRWSASLTEALLACPYKALGERVLRLVPMDPLTPATDARTAGLLAHRWLERAGKEIPLVTEGTAEQAVVRLLALAQLELQHETPVTRAIWKAKFAKLAPALVAQWLADGRTVEVVEKRLAREVGGVTMTATLDRVERAGGGPVIVDFKTSTPPSWPSVASGERPQLAIEAWLLAAENVSVADVEYWQLRGYGPNPLAVIRPSGKYPLDTLLAPVAEGVQRLVDAYGEGAEFAAVPDMAGGGLMATGHCARCALAGVCRRQTVAETGVLGSSHA